MKALSDRFLVRTFRFSSSTARVERAGGPDVRRHADAAGAARSRARARSSPACRCRGWCWSPTAPTRPTRPSPTRCSRRRRRRCRCSPSASGRKRSRTTSRSAASSTPRTALKGTSLLVDAVLTQTGYAGQTVTLDVEDERTHRRLAAGAAAGRRRSRLGARALHRDRSGPARLPPEGGAAARRGRHAEQPARRADRHPRSPRAHPLLRRGAALRDEVRAARDQGRPNLQLVTLQRTAENKHLRLDIDAAGVELAAGFPKTREELFAYRGLVLGSVEASAFTADQLRMIAEFVDVRGGGLLLLGGAARVRRRRLRRHAGRRGDAGRRSARGGDALRRTSRCIRRAPARRTRSRSSATPSRRRPIAGRRCRR